MIYVGWVVAAIAFIALMMKGFSAKRVGWFFLLVLVTAQSTARSHPPFWATFWVFVMLGSVIIGIPYWGILWLWDRTAGARKAKKATGEAGPENHEVEQ